VILGHQWPKLAKEHSAALGAAENLTASLTDVLISIRMGSGGAER
jgi:hypothetical protein